MNPTIACTKENNGFVKVNDIFLFKENVFSTKLYNAVCIKKKHIGKQCSGKYKI